MSDKKTTRLTEATTSTADDSLRPSVGSPNTMGLMAQGHSVDDYLEVIYFLAFPVGEYAPALKGRHAVAARVAEMLGVSRASAGEMIKRLEADGLLTRGPRKELVLTPAGREASERVIRRHRLIERLLTDFMGYGPAECHEHADLLGDTFTDDMIDRIEERLGRPERCPHGWPIDPTFEHEENSELVSLAELGPGEHATIVRLAEHDGSLLHWFYDHGLDPGTAIEVEAAEPEVGQLLVLVDGAGQTITDKAAAGLFVRPQG